jgi:L-ribulokinase
VAAGIYPDIPAAQAAICAPIEKTYTPNKGAVEIYRKLYKEYQVLGVFAEEAAKRA